MRAVDVIARDGFRLAGALVTPADAKPQRVIVVNPALGVPKEFYRRFAEYASERGFAVLLYDYRGIGGSRPHRLRGFEATMRDLGILDIAAAIEFASNEFPSTPIHAVCHSAGGQLLGLASNYATVRRTVMVACSTGTLELLPGRFRLFAALMMHGFIPITTALLGYAPARVAGWGEDLPAGVAREWASWCKSKGYLADSFGRTIEHHYYSDVQSPILAIGMSDDPIANPRTVPALLALYNAAPVETRWVQPSDLGQRQMGHHGFFMSRGRPLWDSALAWLQSPQ